MFRSCPLIAMVALAGIATPAGAVQSVFADFVQIGTASTLRFASTTGTAGGSFSTLGDENVASAEIANVRFSFLREGLASAFTAVPAHFSLAATTGDGASSFDAGSFSFLFQPGVTGHFAFTSVEPITYRGTAYLPGTDLLRGDFSNALISGAAGGSTGSFASLAGGSLVYSSPFLGFAPDGANDFQIALGAIADRLAIATGGAPGDPAPALRQFRAAGAGSFTGDTLLAGGGVPEPANWGLIIIGFAMVGVAARRRDSWRSVTA